MNQEQAFKRLYEIVKHDTALIEQNFIMVENGVYHVFGQWEIHSLNQEYRVIKYNDVQEDFFSLSSALSWCIAEKMQNYNLSRNIHQLDQEHGRLLIDLDMSEKLLAKSHNVDFKEVVRLKTIVKKDALKEAQTRLSKCVRIAKYFQTKGFNDEIARTRRPAQNTTNGSHVRKPNRTKDRV